MSIAAESTDNAADKNNERNFVMMKANFFGQSFDGKGL